MAADSGMGTCPSPEIPDSRKRPLDSDVENGVTKKSHYGGGNYDYIQRSYKPLVILFINISYAILFLCIGNILAFEVAVMEKCAQYGYDSSGKSELILCKRHKRLRIT